MLPLPIGFVPPPPDPPPDPPGCPNLAGADPGVPVHPVDFPPPPPPVAVIVEKIELPPCPPAVALQPGLFEVPLVPPAPTVTGIAVGDENGPKEPQAATKGLADQQPETDAVLDSLNPPAPPPPPVQ